MSLGSSFSVPTGGRGEGGGGDGGGEGGGEGGGDGGGGEGVKKGEYTWIPARLMMRDGPGSTSVTYEPISGLPVPPPPVAQSNPKGPRVAGTVKFGSPHDVDVLDSKSPAD